MTYGRSTGSTDPIVGQQNTYSFGNIQKPAQRASFHSKTFIQSHTWVNVPPNNALKRGPIGTPHSYYTSTPATRTATPSPTSTLASAHDVYIMLPYRMLPLFMRGSISIWKWLSPTYDSTMMYFEPDYSTLLCVPPNPLLQFLLLGPSYQTLDI